MKLSYKITFGIIAGFSFLLLLFVIVVYTIIYPAFYKLEYYEVGQNIVRVDETLTGEMQHLFNLVSDWSIWNDAYYFAKTKNTEFIESNINLDTMKYSNISFIYVLDVDNNVIVSMHCNSEKTEVIEDDVFDTLKFSADNPLLLKDSETNKMGLFFNKGKLYIAAVSRIYKSDTSGISPGIMIMGRIIDEHGLNQLLLKTKVPFKIFDKNNAVSKKNTEWIYEKELSADKNVFMTKSSDFMSIFYDVSDITGAANIGIEIEYPRRIVKQALQTVSVAIIMIVFSIVLISIITSILIRKIIIRPLSHLSQSMNEIEDKSDYGQRIGESRKDEIGSLISSFNKLLERISLQSNELEAMTLSDALTKISNRRKFDNVIGIEWNRHIRLGNPMAILLLDIDYFKLYNDFYGHLKGDDCLVQVAALLNSLVKRSGDLVARYGGEEFVVLLHSSGKKEAIIVAERILSAFAEEKIVHEKSQISNYLTVSIGVSFTYPKQSLSIKEFFDCADIALYSAKEKCRNRFELLEYPIKV